MKMLYHLSKENLNKKILKPRIPNNFLTKNGYEDNKTKRVCFTPSIDKSLRAMSQNLKGLKFYVHVPDGEYKTYKPSIKEVPDCKLTGEIWIKEPVKLKCIGIIIVIKDKGEEGLSYKYGNNIAELYDWEWKYIKKFNESMNIINESFVFSKDDLYYNFDKFQNGTNKVLLITGLSGSGKSTLAKKLALKYKANYIELDCFNELFNVKSEMDIKKESKELYLWYKKNFKSIEDMRNSLGDIDGEYTDYISSFINYCIDSSKKKNIIEGTHIYELYDLIPNIKSHSIIIKNTSVVRSIYQKTVKREKWKIKDIIKDGPNLLKWLIKSEKDIENFKNALQESVNKLITKHLYL